MNLRKPHFKQIQLLPTEFTLDLWICSDIDNLHNGYAKKYNKSADFFKEELTHNCTYSFICNDRYRHITIAVNSLDLGTIVHEAVHSVYHLSQFCKVGVGLESQEWVACMVEYIFNHAKDFKSYEVIE